VKLGPGAGLLASDDPARIRGRPIKQAAAAAHIRQLCALELPAEAIMPALLRSIHGPAPCDLAAFFWVDSAGDMTHMYSEKMLSAEATGRYFGLHYESAVHAFRERLLAMVRGGELTRESVVDSRTQASNYYREILEPLGAFRILHGIVRDRGTPLGLMALYRPQHAAGFSSAEHAIVATACRYLLQAMRCETRPGDVDQYRESGQAALLVCARDGSVRQASGRGHALLAQASGCRINRHTITGELQQSGLALLRRLLAGAIPDPAADAQLPSLQSTNEWGSFRLRAYPLGEDFGVLIERHEHLMVRLVDAMRGLQLSAQQREVALLLARGRSNAQIGEALGVSLNTATYHVKQLYGKLDAHDRAEAIARILEGHTVRR
jgi:DNA-binding CsgD family transcriptional regulator